MRKVGRLSIAVGQKIRTADDSIMSDGAHKSVFWTHSGSEILALLSDATLRYTLLIVDRWTAACGVHYFGS